jgi:type IV pilus assembly protein PilA
MWLTDEDSGLIFDVLEVHDDGLTVHGESGTFTIRPPSPEAVCLLVEEGDPASLVLAAQSVGYVPISGVCH